MATASQEEREALISRVHAALERTNGHRTHAALALGVTPKQLHEIIRRVPALTTRWGKGPGEETVAPDELATEIHRDPPPAGVISAAIAKQDAILAEGWERLGYDPQRKGFLDQLQIQYASNVRGTMDLAFGGAAHANTKLLFQLEDLYKLSADIDAFPDKYEKLAYTEGGQAYVVKTADEFKLEVVDRILKTTETLRKMSATVEQANKVRLQVAQMEKDLMKKEGPKRVAGWEAPVDEAQ